MSPDPWGHPGQVPYVMVWQDLVEDPPKWLKPFVHKRPDSPNVQALLMETPLPQRKPRRIRAQNRSCGNPRTGTWLTWRQKLGPHHMPLLCCRFPQGEEPPPNESEGIREPWPQRRNTGNRGEQDHGDPELPSSTVQALPIQVGPANLDGEWTCQYWPFSTSDLYNWKTPNTPFLEKPQGLIDLLDSILFTHNPTWDDCQQLLQVLFITEEREWILTEVHKRVPGVDGRQPLSLISWTRGFLCCGLTGILSEWKVGSISKCTARL